MSLCTTRLRKEYKELQRNQLENIKAAPKETNILEWHYVISGQKDSPYAGGFYHGTVLFPSDYPYKPPTIRMITPSGRFKPGARLCLSMSDFHPESWNPMWSVGTILLGLYSFMNDTAPTNGSEESSEEEKKLYARASIDFNLKDKIYCDLFPELVEAHLQAKKVAEENEATKPENDTETEAKTEVDSGSTESTTTSTNGVDSTVDTPVDTITTTSIVGSVVGSVVDSVVDEAVKSSDSNSKTISTSSVDVTIDTTPTTPTTTAPVTPPSSLFSRMMAMNNTNTNTNNTTSTTNTTNSNASYTSNTVSANTSTKSVSSVETPLSAPYKWDTTANPPLPPA